MLKNVYEGLNARPKVYLSKEYFCKMYPTCVSSKLFEFIQRVLFDMFFHYVLKGFCHVMDRSFKAQIWQGPCNKGALDSCSSFFSFNLASPVLH